MVEGEIKSGLKPGDGPARRARWRWRWLLGSFLFAATLLASKFAPPFDAFWYQLDMVVFRATNGSLAWGSGWQWFWAITNHRAFDALAGGYFLLVFCWFVHRGHGRERRRRLAAGGFIFAWTVTVLDISSDWVFSFDHPSPTLAVPNALRLSEMVPHVELKDASGASFPGDHGTALILFTGMTGFFAGARLGFIAAVGAMFFAMPRLMSGAHWLSDITVGSVSVALVGLSLALATPLHAIAVRLLTVPVTIFGNWLAVFGIRYLAERGTDED